MRVLMGLLLVLVLAGPGWAWDGASCLQRQLNALGYGAGAVDGQIGPATRRALERYEGVAGPLGARALTQATAIIHCRKLGLRHALARSFWVTNDDRFDIILQEGTPPGFRSALRQGMLNNYFYMRGTLGFDLAGPVTAIAGDNPKELRRLAGGHIPRGFGGGQIAADMRRLCEAELVRGISYPGLIVICFRRGSGLSDTDLARVVSFVAEHEFAHEAQWQLSGSDASDGPADGMGLNGPLWLVEGMAEYIAWRGLTAEEGGEGLREVKRLGDKDRPALKRLERRGPATRAGDATYLMGRTAVWLLSVGNSRKGAPLGFYDLVGSGMAWPEAFEATFGKTPAAFYEEWERTVKYAPG